MSRLTERNPLWINDEMWLNACEPDDEEIEAVYRRLKEYEDLEEQGRLIKLPCKIGDTVWEVNKERNIVSEFTIKSVTKYPLSIQFNWKLVNGIYRNIAGFADFHIGKTVFLTKSEAYEKLKELRGDNNE